MRRQMVFRIISWSTFLVIVLLGMGVESLERLTEITEDETEWKQFKEALASRVGNVNVVSALILACVFALELAIAKLIKHSRDLAFAAAWQRS
jgi:hypothetical protein